MNGSSFTIVTLGVVNLLLITAGVLMAYFDWNAARKREFLYLYFTEERPSSNFFYAAKRRRGQVSRLLLGFILLLLRQFLVNWLHTAVSGGVMNEHWVRWWQTGNSHPDLDGLLRLYPWIYWLEISGIGPTGFWHSLPRPRRKHGASRSIQHRDFGGLVDLFSFVIILRRFGGDNSVFVARDSALVMRTHYLRCGRVGIDFTPAFQR